MKFHEQLASAEKDLSDSDMLLALYVIHRSLAIAAEHSEEAGITPELVELANLSKDRLLEGDEVAAAFIADAERYHSFGE